MNQDIQQPKPSVTSLPASYATNGAGHIDVEPAPSPKQTFWALCKGWWGDRDYNLPGVTTFSRNALYVSCFGYMFLVFGLAMIAYHFGWVSWADYGETSVSWKREICGIVFVVIGGLLVCGSVVVLTLGCVSYAAFARRKYLRSKHRLYFQSVYFKREKKDFFFRSVPVSQRSSTTKGYGSCSDSNGAGGSPGTCKHQTKRLPSDGSSSSALTETDQSTDALSTPRTFEIRVEQHDPSGHFGVNVLVKNVDPSINGKWPSIHGLNTNDPSTKPFD